MSAKDFMAARVLSACLVFFFALQSEAQTDTVATNAASYLIQPGDVLQISVWHEADLQREVLVRPDGGISFPLVGDLAAADGTVAQLTATLTERLVKFIPEPEVNISIKSTGSRIYVIGRVNRPGEFAIMRPVNVLQALSMAGGLTPYAERKRIKVLRGDGSAQEALPVNYAAIERGKQLEQNILLQSGDVVVVP